MWKWLKEFFADFVAVEPGISAKDEHIALLHMQLRREEEFSAERMKRIDELDYIIASFPKEMERYAEEIEKLKAELGQKEGELAKTKGKLNEIVNGLDANKFKLGWIVEFEDGVIEHLQKEANQ